MAGVLLYTAAPDSEGTLGGLVSLGQPEELRRHIGSGIEVGRRFARPIPCAQSEHPIREG